jgi:hypothetical protein
VNRIQTPGALSIVQTAGLAASGPVGGPFSPSAQSYTLTNTGTSSIRWTAKASKTWASLSSSSGTLAAGASTNVTVSLNSGANKLAAGTYGNTISFTNTTNGNGSTSRTITLTVKAPAPAAPGPYTATPTEYNWVEPTRYSRVSLRDDAISSRVTLPFKFTYYGKTYTTMYIGSNGLLGFTSSGMTAYNNVNIPHVSGPNNAIYPYWDDLNPAVGGVVKVASVGISPNRMLVVSWVGVPLHYNTATKLTFQAILCEGSNDIIFQYQNVGTSIYGAGASATIGIENQIGTDGCRYSYNTKSVTDGTAIRFSTQAVGFRSVF